MTKNEQVDFWIKNSQQDLIVAQDNFNLGHYNYCLFFCHLSLEKLIKAIYIFNNNKSAPFIHDLVKLTQKCKLELTKTQTTQLAQITKFNLEARYNEYKQDFYKIATKKYASSWLKTTRSLHQWLLKNMQ